ncbi:hypothetical protein [Geminocystis herdmanii]|uniref:hypothetical protein n=1 Tax=Geminocystis herdmanii TaxID=669359 RepID=UPI00034D73DE|nr:hypothetical protein [Geminocystis herdmanii]
MTLLEIVKLVGNLSQEDKDSLFEILKEEKIKVPQKTKSNNETFWEMTLRFREKMEQEGIEFDDADFADLRDKSVGREVEL